jgi:hypothetical protein
MPQPKDKELYEKIKNEITSKYKPSAYRSGMIVRKYKEEYYKKHKNNNAYTGDRNNSNLRKWFLEQWTNQRGEIGYKNKGDIYRPTIRINNKTPTTFNELTKEQIKKAQKEKKTKGRVKQFSKL